MQIKKMLHLLYTMRLLLLILLISNCCVGQSQTRKEPSMSDSSVNLFAFIAKKVSIKEFDPNEKYSQPISIEIDSASGDTIVRRMSYIMDFAFEAKYVILQPVFNDLKVDTITFNIYDHYGRPAFEKYSNVLLYISKSEDGLHYFLQKYQFDPVYKSTNHSWVGRKKETLLQLFNSRKNTVFRERGLF